MKKLFAAVNRASWLVTWITKNENLPPNSLMGAVVAKWHQSAAQLVMLCYRLFIRFTPSLRLSSGCNKLYKQKRLENQNTSKPKNSLYPFVRYRLQQSSWRCMGWWIRSTELLRARFFHSLKSHRIKALQVVKIFWLLNLAGGRVGLHPLDWLTNITQHCWLTVSHESITN